MNQPPQIDPTILKNAASISCDNCKNETFTEGVMLKKLSRFVTGTPKDAVVPIPLFICTRCQNVNEEFIPEILRNKSDDAV
jgi:hypothetical protein